MQEIVLISLAILTAGVAGAFLAKEVMIILAPEVAQNVRELLLEVLDMEGEENGRQTSKSALTRSQRESQAVGRLLSMAL